jgi:hypothetical protein
MMEGDPAAPLLESTPTDQEMRFRSVRLNDVRPPAGNDFTQRGKHRGIEAPALRDYIQLNSGDAHCVQKSVRLRSRGSPALKRRNRDRKSSPWVALNRFAEANQILGRSGNGGGFH